MEKFGNPCSREQINETWSAATNEYVIGTNLQVV